MDLYHQNLMATPQSRQQNPSQTLIIVFRTGSAFKDSNKKPRLASCLVTFQITNGCVARLRICHKDTGYQGRTLTGPGVPNTDKAGLSLVFTLFIFSKLVSRQHTSVHLEENHGDVEKQLRGCPDGPFWECCEIQ